MTATAVQVRERPILFSEPMVRAILAGHKTQTRRVVKPQPQEGSNPASGPWVWWNGANGPSQRAVAGCVSIAAFAAEMVQYSPYGQPGDRLWVRETFCHVDDREYGGDQWYDYRATPKYGPESPAGWDRDQREDPDCARWHPSIHMPRAASRLTLEVTEVRVERLQDISSADAWQEGVRPDGVRAHAGEGIADHPDPEGATLDAFFALWDSINAERGFDVASNPWVWVIGFRRTLSEQRASAGGER